MYGKNLSGHTSLVLRPIKALLLLLFPAFEGLHDNIKFVITACIQRKLFKGNDRQGEREQTIVIDMIAETSATKNNLSRDNLLWPSACFVSSSKV